MINSIEKQLESGVSEEKIISTLPDKNIDITDTEHGYPLFFWALCLDHYKSAAFLLHSGANINARNKDGFTVIEASINLNKPAVMRFLLDYKDHIKLTDEESYFILVSAIDHGYYDCASILLQIIDINVRGEAGYTALEKMVQLNKPEGVKFLLDRGASKEYKEDKSTLLHWAAALGASDEIIELLLNSGIDPDAETASGKTALMLAIEQGYPSIAEKLLAVTKNIDAVRKSDGKTALALVMMKGDTNLEKKLLAKTLKTREVEISEDLTVKEHQRKAKKDILDHGPLAALPTTTERPTSPQVIESILYLGEKSPRTAYFTGEADAIYTSCQTLRPLMDIMALSGLDIYDRGKSASGKRKFLKIVVLKEDSSVAKLRVLHSIKCTGVYPGKNTVFASFTRHCERIAFGSLMHESAHFVMGEVFKNGLNPYFAQDEDAKQAMQSVMDALHKRLSSMEKTKRYEQYAFIAIASVFENYPSKKWAIELAVKIPEIISVIGRELASTWMRRNVPELLRFYRKYINPRLIGYLQSHHAENYLTIDTSVYDSLLEFRQDVEWKPSDIELAARQGDVAKAQYLLKDIRDDTLQNFGPCVASHLSDSADTKGCEKILDILFSSPFIERITSRSKADTLLQAAISDNPGMVELILDRSGKDISEVAKGEIFLKVSTYGLENIADILLRQWEIPDEYKERCFIAAINGFHNELAGKLWEQWQKQLPLQTKRLACVLATKTANVDLAESINADLLKQVREKQVEKTTQSHRADETTEKFSDSPREASSIELKVRT